MKPTNINDPNYFHKVVDCQWACPAHTPVPEYIRLIAEKRYTDAYMINWHSNVFPGILGRTCDRPCEPACRRGRVEDEPVAICRLKRVAADYKSNIKDRLPKIPKKKIITQALRIVVLDFSWLSLGLFLKEQVSHKFQSVACTLKPFFLTKILRAFMMKKFFWKVILSVTVKSILANLLKKKYVIFNQSTLLYWIYILNIG